MPHERFEGYAARTPSATAVRYRDQSLTYGELNRCANRLSRYLTSRGIGRESRVVVCVQPSFDALIALLGILKAGAAYVPLDPTHPAAHVQSIVDDTHPALVLVNGAPNPVFADANVLALDVSSGLLSECSSEDPERPVDREATAYVYYTSGTTGKPKGVMASYANLASYVAVARERYGFSATDVMPALARFSFSISMFELLTPLSAGGRLLVLDREHVVSPERMMETLRGVTLFHAGPSLLRPIVDHIKSHHSDFAAFSRVRHASSGGDMIAPEVLESAKEVFPNAEVFVIYGCSEIACMGCTYEVPRDRRITKTFVGRPFDDMAVRVVDDALERVPIGEVGEICFSGNGVVKGYLNRPDLTASKFVDIEGRRFYRTGDMGRVTEEGWLEILGRVDFQAKIRGMRVELGEVEYHLRRAPNVKDAVVMAREGAGGEKVLVAYVVSSAGDEIREGRADPTRAAALRRHMVEHVPDYMVPAIYLEIPKLPLNHNMKLDRRALPAPASVPSSRAHRPPETRTEIQLASLWKDLLRVDGVQLHDNFFELGGDSLLAVRFTVDVERQLGVALGGMDVLRESLEVLARICDAGLGRPSYKAREAASPISVADHTELFHFGADDALYGVLTRPNTPRHQTAVLVCAPVGQEKARAHFVLQSLVRRLSVEGVPALQFDYYGCGDSLGDGIGATCTRWRRDVADALAELARRTGATRVTAVGVRLGATLLWNAAEGLEVERFVLWDPVVSGSEYVAALTAMHRRCLEAREHFSFRKRPESKLKAEGVQLLGSTYSAAALAELRALSIAVTARSLVPTLCLATSRPAGHAVALDGVRTTGDESHVTTLDTDCFWEDPSRIEDILPDAHISAALTRMILEP